MEDTSSPSSQGLSTVFSPGQLSGPSDSPITSAASASVLSRGNSYQGNSVGTLNPTFDGYPYAPSGGQVPAIYFRNFTRLSSDCQNMIWDFALTIPRVVHFGRTQPRNTNRRKTDIPPLLSVCWTSRKRAQKFYKTQSTPIPYFNPDRDILLMGEVDFDEPERYEDWYIMGPIVEKMKRENPWVQSVKFVAFESTPTGPSWMQVDHFIGFLHQLIVRLPRLTCLTIITGRFENKTPGFAPCNEQLDLLDIDKEGAVVLVGNCLDLVIRNSRLPVHHQPYVDLDYLHSLNRRLRRPYNMPVIEYKALVSSQLLAATKSWMVAVPRQIVENMNAKL